MNKKDQVIFNQPRQSDVRLPSKDNFHFIILEGSGFSNNSIFLEEQNKLKEFLTVQGPPLEFCFFDNNTKKLIKT